jgi:transposase
MAIIIPPISYSGKRKFDQRFAKCRSAAVRVHYLIILCLWNGHSARATARFVNTHNTTVYRVAQRFRDRGEASLWDGRQDNGPRKLDADFLGLLDQVVRSSPHDHGWRRPTWTCELLVKTMFRKTGVRIHPATMSRALARIKARRGMPRPTVGCPWSKWRKTRRLNEIGALLASLPKNEAAVYEDEVDVHLNPKIGLDWMGRGQQKEVATPGKNVKRYLAGALDVRTGQLHWTTAEQKNSWLFLDLLEVLVKAYPEAKKIHVILDNYGIHDSKIVEIALSHFAARIRLHFLPPYCPQHNKIERVWKDLHANVTRNHNRARISTLMKDVNYYLQKRNRRKQRLANLAA